MRDQRERAEYFRDQDERMANGELTFSGPYCFPDRHPGFLLKITILTGLTFVSFLYFRNSLWPTLFSLGAFSLFPYWLLYTYYLLSLAESSNVAGLDSIIYRGSNFDVTVFVLVSIIIVSQILALSLAVIRKFKRDLPMP